VVILRKLRCVLCNVCVAHSAFPTYNAALNRPAYQSSVWVDDRGSWNASFANDGIHETNAHKDDKPWCSASQAETNPWWAVDLGRPTTVYRVDFTNRDGPSGMQLFYLEFHMFPLLSGILLQFANKPCVIRSSISSIFILGCVIVAARASRFCPISPNPISPNLISPNPIYKP